MGFSDTLEQLGIPYDSSHAYDFADRVFEFISYMAIDESANLAQTRGAYKNFKGSGWSKGMVPIDTIAKVEKERGVPVTVDRTSKHKGLNWDLLREKVKKGMRNATLMAVAPNANIGLLAATTPGFDPRFAQVFSRNKISGKYLDLNHNLVTELKNLNIWESVKSQIIEHQGDISQIPGIPDHIKAVYKTSFTTSPFAYIEVAARAQKWVDQALSRNMYLESRDIDETMNIYMAAWEKGVKTTYYLHMKPRHTAEQSTVSVNKAQVMGKVGFGGLKKSAEAPLQAPVHATTTTTFAATTIPTPEPIPVVIPVATTTIPAPQIASFVKTASPSPIGFQAVQTSIKTEELREPVTVSKKPNVRIIGEKTCPTDPQDLLQCDSCQ
jgi:ribonucleoside-diphosphate reductase alpha chain